MDKYAVYLCVIIRNLAGERLTREDIEETASDVFFALWENADRIEKLKPWLAATARNKAKNKLRGIHTVLPLDESLIAHEAYEMDDVLQTEEEHMAVKSAITRMDSPDREIFQSYYYGSQTAAAISAQLGMTESAIKQRLVRGRRKLEAILSEEEGKQ